MLTNIFLYLIIAVTGIQLIYIWLVYGRLAFYKPKQISDIQAPVSVIVAARNEYENLQKLIPALLAQEYPDFEIIIVDDKSYDGTYDYLLEAQQEHERLKLVRVNTTPEHLNAKKYALTLGIKAAQHEIVLLTDADCMPRTNQWIAEMQKYYHGDKEIVLGLSPYERHKGLLNAFIRFETFHTAVQYLSLAILGKPYMGVGRNLSYKKSLFFANKGYHKHRNITGGDDDLLISAIATGKNTNIAFTKDAQMMSIPKLKWGEWIRQKVRHLSVGKQYKLSDVIILGGFNASYFWSYPSLLLGWAVGLHPGILAAAYGIRMLSLLIVFFLTKKKFEQDIEIYLVPLMDILYIFYYIFVGVKAYSSKKVAWR